MNGSIPDEIPGPQKQICLLVGINDTFYSQSCLFFRDMLLEFLHSFLEQLKYVHKSFVAPSLERCRLIPST